MALLLVELSDELWSGVAVVAAPDVEHAFGLSHAGYTLAVFAVPLLLSAALEALLALLSDRVSRRRFLVWGLLGLSGSLLLAAWAPSVAWLTTALALAGAASGACCGAAQAVLVAQGDAERALARWTFFGALGDVGTPLLLGAVAWAGGSYRSALVGIALLIALQGLRFHFGGELGRELTEPELAEEEVLPVREALRRGASNGRLWCWLFGVACCSLLDELVCALLSLRLEQTLAASPSFITVALTAISLGAVLGSAVTERLLARQAATGILVANAVLCFVALLVSTLASSPEVVLIAVAMLGATSAAHYPLLLARAYREVPDSPGLVNALGQLFVWMDIGAPLLMGSIADRQGLTAALLCLSAQPVVVATLALTLGRARPRAGHDDERASKLLP